MQSKSMLGCWLFLATVILSRLAFAASVSDFSEFSLSDKGPVLLPGRLFIPPEATSDPSMPRPLILFLHGGGESGSNNLSQINGNIDHLLTEAKRRGAFLYAPQTINTWSSATVTDRVMAMIDRAIADQNVDATRLYVTGLSNGGGGTWNMLSRYADRFAAAVPICGVSPASDFVPSNLIAQGIASFHARNDSVVSNSISRGVINSILATAHQSPPTYPSPSDPDFAFSSTSLDLRYIEFGAGGHGIWGRIYNTPAMYEWLFAHTTAVPEPTAAVSMTTAIIMIVVCRRRRRPSCRAPGSISIGDAEGAEPGATGTAI